MHFKYPTKERPLSWSSISSFQYDKEKWYQSYVLGKRDPESAEMKFGKIVGEKLASDPTYLPQVPRLSKYEHPFKVMFNGIPLIGYADTYCDKTKKKLYEFKTGVKAWDQKRVDEHPQIDMYLLMHYITEKIKPEEVECQLIWLPTKRTETGNFEVSIDFLDDPVVPQIFKTTRTMQDIIRFGSRINSTVKEMNEYIKNHE